jgi:importin-5
MNYRQNPAVLSQAPTIFKYVVDALEAETIQGQIALRVVASVKDLLGVTHTDAQQLVGSLSPETQAVVRTYFS